MKKIFQIIVCFTILYISIHTLSVHAYGWGYKRNTEHKIPEIGKFEQIIKKHDAFYVDESGEKNIYLTFDNGYEQGYTGHILDVLAKHEVRATFFVTGHYVSREPDLIKRMVNDGHIIGNHSYYHPDFTKLQKDDVKKELVMVENAVADITEQKEMNYLRPPRGTFNEQTLQWANEFGYTHVFWSLAFKDWEVNNQKGWKYAYDELMEQIHPGAIILLHTVSKDNAEALNKVIVALKKQGYTFKSLDDLMMKTYFPSPLLF